MSEFYVCYAWNKIADITDSSLYILKVNYSLNEYGELVWEGCTRLSPLMYDLIGFDLFTPPFERLPDVYTDDNGIVRLKACRNAAEYTGYNPMRILPYKSGFFRTITLIGVTKREKPRFRTFNMTNRRIEILDEHYCDYGYFVCDYNGSVSYLTKEQTISIINRYGAANAVSDGDRIKLITWDDEIGDTDDITDGLPRLEDVGLPLFASPQNTAAADNMAPYSDADDNTAVFDIADLRTYADSFFTIRRQRIKNDTALTEFTESIEAFHQALVFGTVSEHAYMKIRGKLGSFRERLESGSEYQFIENDLMSQLRGIPFVRTDAFNEMLSHRKSALERLVNLQTLCDMNRDIVRRYSEHLLAETWLTKCMNKLCEKTGTRLEGTETRIKSPASLYGKLYERNSKEGKTPEELFGGTCDIIRYTVCFDEPTDYCGGTEAFIKELIGQFPGSQLERFRNYWTPYVSNQYRGINTVIRLPDMCYDHRSDRLVSGRYSNSRNCTPIRSLCFEVQFHTAASLKIKEDTHKMYEKLRRHDTDDNERAMIKADMEKANEQLEVPEGAPFMSLVSNEYIEAMKALREHLDRALDGIRDNAGTCLADTSLLQ